MKAFLDAWILKPEYLPAWLQAAAAIVALGTSAWAVWWTNAAARQRDRLELRGVAVAVYPEILMLKVTTKQVREGVAEMKKRYGTLVGQSVAASLQMTASIQVPPMIERNID